MGIRWEYDGNMMGIWEYDGNMMGIWRLIPEKL